MKPPVPKTEAERTADFIGGLVCLSVVLPLVLVALIKYHFTGI